MTDDANARSVTASFRSSCDSVSRFCLVLTGVLTAAQVAFVWALPYPIGVDLPGHTVTMAILSRYHEMGFDRFFTVEWFPTPYLVANGLLLFFSFFMGFIEATKAMISLYFILLPFCVRFWIHSFPRPDDRKTLLAAALAYNGPFFGGSFNHLFGLMMSLVVLGAWRRDAEASPQRRQLRLALGLAALYFCHFTPFVLTALILLVWHYTDRARRPRVAEVYAALLVPALLFSWYCLRMSTLTEAVVPRAFDAYGSYAQAFINRWGYAWTAFHFWGDVLTQIPTVAGMLLLGIGGIREGRWTRPLAVAVGIPILATLVLPHTVHVTHAISARLAHMVLFLSLPVLAMPSRGVQALLVLGALGWNAYVGANLIRIQGSVRTYMALLDRVPPRTPVFPLFEKSTQGPESRIFSVFNYLVGYHHALKGGVSPQLADREISPWAAYFAYRDRRYKSSSVLIEDFEPGRFAALYPYLIYRGGTFALNRLAEDYVVLERQGDFTLLGRRPRDKGVVRK